MQLSEVFAVEVRQYIGDDMKTLVPRVLNTSVMQADRRSVAAVRGELWTEERSYTDVLNRNGEDAFRIMRSIQAWAQSQPNVALFFGRGKSDGSIQITHKLRDDHSAYQRAEDTVSLSLWSLGRVEIEFKYLKKRPSFVAEAMRKELHRRLTSESTLKIDASRIEARPSIPWTDFVEPKNYECLVTAMQWVIQHLNEDRRAASDEVS